MDVSYRRKFFRLMMILFLVGLYSLSLQGHSLPKALASDNGLAQKPYLGWSSWSALRSNISDQIIEAQADAMATNLASHGYSYINIDAGWADYGRIDGYGIVQSSTTKFPNGITPVASYVHNKGLKLGVYLNPGIPDVAVTQNTPIQGTSYHAQDIVKRDSQGNPVPQTISGMDYVDFSKAGAQAYFNSWANELASWGVDFLKLDFVDTNDIPDVQAWSQALKQSGRSIWFDLSYDLPLGNASTWRQYANSWRINDDIECYCSTLSGWNQVSVRFQTVPEWAQWSGPGGWNNLDSLEVGGDNDGLSNDERQTFMTLWAISAAPLYVGDDLTKLDSYGLGLLTNDEVLGVDQAGIAAAPIVAGTQQQVWRAYNPDGSYTVALFNLSSSSANVTVDWASLGFTGSASVRDLWSRTNLGSVSNSFSATLNAHASRLLKVVPATAASVTSYEAESSANTLGGAAAVSSCSGCSGGQQVGYIGGNNGTLQFNGVQASENGTANLLIYYATQDYRSAQISVNNGPALWVAFPSTGGWTSVGELTLTIPVTAGSNTIKVYNSDPNGWAPNIDRIVLSPGGVKRYEAESSVNTIAGGATVASCSFCSGGQKVGYVGGNSGTLQFNNVYANTAGTYTIAITYISGDPRNAQLSVNSAASSTISFPSTGSWSTTGTLTVQVNLNAGNNTLKFFTTSSSNWAPDFDAIQVTAQSSASYEAEASGNTLGGNATTQSCSNCSGGLKVGNIGGNNGTLQFNTVNVSTGGPHTLTLVFVNADTSRTGYVSVNNGAGFSLQFLKTGNRWTDIAPLTITVNLNAGSNTIKLYNPNSDYAPDFDRILVQ